ncbi:MAG: hypothetical protein HQ580_07320, partial [Planctomycetes bacterium]|nr:hypothetical protein [Planctomycetota bacterium]
MAEMSELSRWERELAQFNEVLAEPEGQAIVIVGPAGSGKSDLLGTMVLRGKKGEKFQCYGNIYRVGPSDHPKSILQKIGSEYGGKMVYIGAKYVLERLRESVEEFGDLQRRVVGVDAYPKQPADFGREWSKIIPELPPKVKFIFTQRPDGILATNKQFMGLPNVVRIDIKAPPAFVERSKGKFKEDENKTSEEIEIESEELKREFRKFMLLEKEYPKEWIKGRQIQTQPHSTKALCVISPDSNEIITTIGFCIDDNPEERSVISSRIHDYKHLINNKHRYKQSIDLGYIVTPEISDSNYLFSIYEVIDGGDPKLIDIEQFLNFEELRRKMEQETEASVGESGQRIEGEDRLEQEVVKLEKRYKLKFSLETKNIIKVAMQLAGHEGIDTWKLHTRGIVIAIAYHGLKKESKYNTSQFFLEKLRNKRSNSFENYFNRIVSDIIIDKNIQGKELIWSGYVGDAIREAKKIAISTTNNNLIHIRHLLAGLFFFKTAGKATRDAHKVLKEAEIDLTTFLSEFQLHVKNTFAEDNAEAWEHIFREPKQEAEDQKLTISHFRLKLDADGIEMCDKVIELATSSNVGLYTDISDESYINLRVTSIGNKSDNVSIQIHIYGEYETTIALAVAGTQKGAEQKEPKLNDFIVKGDITKLSGHKKGIGAERAWLNGNLPVKGSREKANVYVIEREILENESAWKDIENLLKSVNEKAEGESDEKDVETGVLGIATVAGDKPENIEDMLGREDLVDALSNIFLYTAEDIEGFTVALLGNWGEGKTTVMELVKKKLQQLGPRRFEFAKFNAWEYELTDNIAAGLAQQIVKGLMESSNCYSRFIFKICFIVSEHWAGLLRLVLYCGIASIPLLLAYYKANLPKEFLGVGFGGASLVAAFYIFKNTKQIFEHPLATKLETFLKLPSYGEHLGLVPVLKRHIKT